MDDRNSQYPIRFQHLRLDSAWTLCFYKKYADINADDSLAPEATGKNSILWYRYPYLWTENICPGGHFWLSMEKKCQAPCFYTAGATEKSVDWRITNLTDGDHVLTLKVDPDSPDGRKKISLDSFDILKLHQYH